VIEASLYIALFAGCAAFMWWRFYVSARDQVATVKWAKYRRSDEPVTYWFSTSMMAIGALMTTLIALIFCYGLFAGFTG
jgi:hypothetical protein